MNILGSIFFIFLFLVRLAQVGDGGVVPLLLALQSVMAAFFLAANKPAGKTSHSVTAFLAWVCVFLPFAFELKNVNTSYSLPGLIWAVWALITLGSSFSISPEDRGIVDRGPYRFVRHPMYLGEMLSMFGLCLAAKSAWNWMAFFLFVLLQVLRISAEEDVLSQYDRYRKAVRWRILPGIW